jgi:putative ABC transport system ATP-binding protein
LANRHDHQSVNLRSRNGPVLDDDGQAMTMRSLQVAASAVDATKVYGTGVTAVRALDAVTIHIGAAHMVAIMGPSGSGKSTLLHCMAGLDTLTGGRVTVGERDLASLSDRELTVLRRERIGFVFQDFNLIPTLSAVENIALPFRLGGKAPDAARLDEVVDSFGLGDRLSHRPSELSGGQQQRVAIARAVVTRPAIVFADEPTGNLDSRSGGELLALLRRAVDDLGQTIVMVTHDPVAAAHADEVVFLSDGRIVDRMEEPTPARVLDRIKGLGD